MPKKMPFVTVFFLITVFISGCSNSKSIYEEPNEDDKIAVCGGTIVEAGIADARNLVPILASDGASGNICGLVFNGLVKYDKNLILTGDLAKSWNVSDDGLEIIFHFPQSF